MAANFQILQSNPGEFHWVLTNQGRVLAKSESYTRKASCLKAMESFRAAVPTADIVDTTTKDVKFAPPAGVPGRAARTSGRVVGKAAAKVAEAPALAKSAVESLIDAVVPTPRKRARRAT
jgi:uncharacterized protein YegP (UPF0339 family)